MLAFELADFALNDALLALPAAEAARKVMALSLLDWAGCAIAGRNQPVSRILRAQVLDEGGRGVATLVGSAVRVPARAAALANGAISHALDFDDTHFAHIGHPSVAVMPAALALGERVGAPLDEVLAAALIGAEASVRVGLWLGRGHYQGGFHQTATAGAFGAALAGARLMRLGRVQLAHALGLVATRASGLKAQFGTMGKPYNAGMAAANGVEAVELAARGMRSDPAALDGAFGFGATHMGAGEAGAMEGLGRRWLISNVSLKFHACCHGLHAMLEALARALEEAGDETGDGTAVVRVDLRAHRRWESVCNIVRPASGLEGKFSFRHAAALRLAGHDTGAPESFDDALVDAPRISALREAIDVRFDDALGETEAEAVVHLASGRRVRARHDLGAPLALGERRRRVRAKLRVLLGPQQAGALWRAVLERRDARALAALLANPDLPRP